MVFLFSKYLNMELNTDHFKFDLKNKKPIQLKQIFYETSYYPPNVITINKYKRSNSFKDQTSNFCK